MSRRLVRNLTTAIGVAAVGAIAGYMLGGDRVWLHYLCKPAATGLILILAARIAPVHSARYRAAVLAGLVFSLFGDIFLMLPFDAFAAGLVSFLLAHSCFVVAFFPGAGWKQRLPAIVAYAAVGAANLCFLLPKLPRPLVVPVLAYVAALLLMAAFAAARAWTQRRDEPLARPARLAALGGALFVLSDTLLAWNRFGGGIPLAALLILAPYYAALWCIALSVRRD